MHGSIHDSNFKQVAGHVEPGRTELFPISKGKYQRAHTEMPLDAIGETDNQSEPPNQTSAAAILIVYENGAPMAR